MSKSWYDIEAKGERATVYLYDEIGAKGITAKEFAAEFNAIEASHIDLHVESFGGSVVQGTAIKNTIRNHKAHVTAHIDAMAGSIASAIVLGCDEIKIAEDAYVMIHKPYSRPEGDADELRKEADILDKMAEAMAKEYAAKMKITIEEAEAIMAEETWYVGQEAVDAGFADSTYAGTQAVASFDPERFSAKAPEAAVKRFTKSPPSGNSKPSANSKPKGNAMSDETTATEEETTVDETETQTTETVGESTEETTETAAVNVEEEVQKALAKERTRTAEVTALGGKFGFAADAEKHIASGGSVEDFRAHILAKSPEDWKASLKVRNPSVQADEDEDDQAEADFVAAVKARRKARTGR